MALIFPDCTTVSAVPDTISPPSGNSMICLDVTSSAATTIVVRYRIASGTTTFCGGAVEAGPFEHDCVAGINHICHTLCFAVSASEPLFPVDILVREKGAPLDSRCNVNLKVR